MTREEIEKKIAELKSDYVRIQADLEKATYVGSNTSRGEEVLTAIETELRQLRQLLRTMESSADSIGKRKF
ncbi:MAG: SE1832 family protein [Caldibacillus sp.]